jgi:hypothetical protein
MIDKIQEIHLRHERAHMAPSDWWTVTGADAHQDRAFLLNKVWELSAKLEQLREENRRMHDTFKNLALKLRRGLGDNP